VGEILKELLAVQPCPVPVHGRPSRGDVARSHYLAKPFSCSQLLSAIRDCLDRGQCSNPPIAV
jgi:hypothetical protein